MLRIADLGWSRIGVYYEKPADPKDLETAIEKLEAFDKMTNLDRFAPYLNLLARREMRKSDCV